MDRLLRYFLGQFIRRGTMNFTAASGTKFTCGDGTGRPVSARLLTERTQRRILLNPELALGEAYMDGTFVVENGSIADALAAEDPRIRVIHHGARRGYGGAVRSLSV